jgi:hypothetical protein
MLARIAPLHVAAIAARIVASFVRFSVARVSDRARKTVLTAKSPPRAI